MLRIMAVEPWSDRDVDLVVDAYLALAESCARGQSVNKSAVYSRLSIEVGRSVKAVEYKMLNVSGVLQDLGYGHVPGLVPAVNYQDIMRGRVADALRGRPLAEKYLQRRESALSNGELDGAGSSGGTNRMPVTDLWALATGGAEVAARPVAPSSAPVGPRPAGVEEGQQWLKQALDSETDLPHMLFLVGGPGGGKSHVAAEIVRHLERLDRQDDELAHRTYRYAAVGRELLLVNDATIPSGTSSGSTLADDLNSPDHPHVLACVNRGVLVDEVRREGVGTAGNAVTRWVRGEKVDGSEWRVEQTDSADYFATARLMRGSEPFAALCRVFVDTCSLFEERPGVNVEGGRYLPQPYRIAEFGPETSRLTTPAGALLANVAERLVHESHGAWDPISANLASLESPQTRESVLTLLRAAEVHASQRFSYRQVWGAISRLVAGPLPEQLVAEDLSGWLDAHAPNEGDSLKNGFERLRSLAGVRLHEALFGQSGASETRHPVLSATAGIDPSRDMRPGLPSDGTSGWATPAVDAFGAASLGDSPLRALMEHASSTALNDYCTEFDELLDASYVAVLEEVQDDAWLAEATAWYGTYLTRMLGTATGNPAFLDELRAWTSLWHKSPVVPDEHPLQLHQHLLDLIRPRRKNSHGEAVSQVPLYSSRVTALVDKPTKPTLVVQLSPMHLRTTREGEDLQLVVYREEQPIGSMVLNVDLLREALVTGSGWLGLTDATESTVPRLERFRALNMMAASRAQNRIVLVTPTFEEEVSVEEQA